ncbi:hypothetical protein EGW08_012373 [Elysia chlorotica]|uniref:Ionotropic glutamate receptor C-terminal domain-containing protein n=1 Tax=Elysia chlorotica TaxID=188477 RepID=A0A433TE15_ELYCH|nr:hypothetical protein EGW08_012373 [Elysia chlorotica]
MAQAATTAASTGLPKLTISVTDQKPFVWRDANSNNPEFYTGFVVDLIKEVSRRAGFEYEFSQNDDKLIGAVRGGEWAGVIGDVQSGKATIGAGAITVTADRESVVDFTKPFMTNSINLLVQKPEWTSIGLGYLTRPFSTDYWIMVLVCLLLVGIVFFLIGKFSPYEWGNVAADRDPRGAKNSFTFRNSYLFALSTISWQGFREAPKSLSGRIMAAFWFLFVLFTLIAYTGNLTAYLLARPEQIPDMPFRTYEELLESSDITVGAVNFGSTQKMLMKSRSDTLRSMWSKINSVGSFVDSYEEGVKRVETSNGRFVMFMESASAEYYARKHCNLMLFGENLFPTSMAFAVPKGSLWRKRINDALTQIQDDGMMKQLIDQYWQFGGKCDNVDGRKYVKTAGGALSSLPIYPITLKDMSVAILLFFLGMIVAFVFLAIEILHYAVTKKGKKIERPNILKNPPKIFRGKKAAKKAPEDVEAGAGPSSSGDALESVPLEDAEEPAASSSDELRPEGDEAAKA